MTSDKNVLASWPLSALTFKEMRLVVVESPYAGDVEGNVAYARRCLADCLRRGESPFASHLLYTQPGVLDDGVEGERDMGMGAGFAWCSKADASVFYVDRGVSGGMRMGLVCALQKGLKIEVRCLDREVTVADRETLRVGFLDGLK